MGKPSISMGHLYHGYVSLPGRVDVSLGRKKIIRLDHWMLSDRKGWEKTTGSLEVGGGSLGPWDLQRRNRGMAVRKWMEMGYTNRWMILFENRWTI